MDLSTEIQFGKSENSVTFRIHGEVHTITCRLRQTVDSGTLTSLKIIDRLNIPKGLVPANPKGNNTWIQGDNFDSVGNIGSRDCGSEGGPSAACG